MKSRQTPTKTDNPYEALADDKDRLYVDMAVEGYPHPVIAKKATRQPSTVREWFAKGGRLNAAYKWRQKEHRREFNAAFKKVDQILKDGAVFAALKMLEAVKQSGTWPTTIMAAKDLLSRAGFDPTEKIEQTIKTDEKEVEAAKKIQEYAREIDRAN